MLLNKDNIDFNQNLNEIIEGIDWLNNIQKDKERLFDLAVKKYIKLYDNNIDNDNVKIDFNIVYDKMKNVGFWKLTLKEKDFLKNLYKIAYKILNRSFYIVNLKILPFKTKTKKILWKNNF